MASFNPATNLDGLDQKTAAQETNDRIRRQLYGNLYNPTPLPATAPAAVAAAKPTAASPAAPKPAAAPVAGGAGSAITPAPALPARTTMPNAAAAVTPLFTDTRNFAGNLAGTLGAAGTMAKNALAKIPTPSEATPAWFQSHGYAPADANLAAFYVQTYAPALAAVDTAQAAHDKYLDSLDTSQHLLPLSARVNQYGMDPSSYMNAAQSKAYDTYTANLQGAKDALAKLHPQHDALKKAAIDASTAAAAQKIITDRGDNLTVPQPRTATVGALGAAAKPPATQPAAPVSAPVSAPATAAPAAGRTMTMPSNAPAGSKETDIPGVVRGPDGGFYATGDSVAAAGGPGPNVVSGSRMAVTNAYTPPGQEAAAPYVTDLSKVAPAPSVVVSGTPAVAPGSGVGGTNLPTPAQDAQASVTPTPQNRTQGAPTSPDTATSLFGPRSDFGTPIENLDPAHPQFANRMAPMPQVNVPDTHTRDVAGSNADRAKVMSDIDSQIFRAGLGGASRGRRLLIGQLLAEKAGLVNAGGQQATERADTGTNAGVQAGDAALAQAGENARTEFGANAAAAAQGRELAFRRGQFLDEQAPTLGKDGAMYVRRGGQMVGITGPDGKPFKGVVANPQEAQILNAYDAALRSGNVPPELEAAVRPILARAGGATSNATPYAEGQKLRGPDGKTYVVKNGQPVLGG